MPVNKPELARDTDAREILALYRAATEAAKRTGHSHWDEGYPSEETIRADLKGGYLYVWREDGNIVAAITYMHPDDLDGIGVSWTPVERAVEACRFCLSPTLQGKGRAKAFFLGGIELLREQGVQAMRYLCAKDNAAAYRIYTGVGHRQLEDTEQHGIDFTASKRFCRRQKEGKGKICLKTGMIWRMGTARTTGPAARNFCVRKNPRRMGKAHIPRIQRAI